MQFILSFIASFIETVWEFGFLIIITVVGGVALLFAMYRGRRGETAKTGMPTYSPEFALGAFGFDMTRKMTKGQRGIFAGIVILLALILVVGLLYS